MCRNIPRATFKAKSAYALQPISNAGIDAIVRAVEARKASGLGTGGVILDSYGGAINRVAPGATAFFHRNARFSMQFYAYWNQGAPPRVVNANLRWISQFFAAVRPVRLALLVPELHRSEPRRVAAGVLRRQPPRA